MGDRAQLRPGTFYLRRALAEMGRQLMDFIIILALVLVWIALQIWILPKVGVNT